MKNKTLTYLALSLLCCFCSCTSVDLCPEEGHPHITDMRVRLNWGDTDKDEIPAEMHIIASRIINTWRTRGIVDTSIDPATAGNITQQESSSDNPQTEEGDGSSFYLRGGEYNIFVINDQCTDAAAPADGTEPSPLPIVSISNLDNYIHDNRVSVKDLYLQISSMGDKKPDIVAGNDLPDFNPDEEYLQELKSPIYYAVQKDIDIRTGEPTLIDFDMQRISQRINIILNIRTEGDIKKEDLLPPIMNCPALADTSTYPKPAWTPPASTGWYTRHSPTSLRKPERTPTGAWCTSTPWASYRAPPKGISMDRASCRLPCRCLPTGWMLPEPRCWTKTANL